MKTTALWLLAALGMALPAQAQTVDHLGHYGRRNRVESSQDAAFEFRFGRYAPKIDSEVGGAQPYREIFGDDIRFIGGIEIDWQLLRIPYLGSLGPGVGVGYTTLSADAPLASGNGRAAEQTSLTIVPTYLVGVLRADVLAREFGIPIVPFAKLGVGHAWWWTTKGENLSRYQGIEGQGRSYGWQYALGLMLHLDPLDPQTALMADSSLGINNSYVFLEWYNSDLSGFGNGGLRVGTNSWVAGFAFEL